MKSKSWKQKIKAVFSFRSRSSQSIQTAEPTTPLPVEDDPHTTRKATAFLPSRSDQHDMKREYRCDEDDTPEEEHSIRSTTEPVSSASLSLTSPTASSSKQHPTISIDDKHHEDLKIDDDGYCAAVPQRPPLSPLRLSDQVPPIHAQAANKEQEAIKTDINRSDTISTSDELDQHGSALSDAELSSSPEEPPSLALQPALSAEDMVCDSGDDGDISSASDISSESDIIPVRSLPTFVNPVTDMSPQHLPEPPYAHDDDISSDASSSELLTPRASPNMDEEARYLTVLGIDANLTPEQPLRKEFTALHVEELSAAKHETLAAESLSDVSEKLASPREDVTPPPPLVFGDIELLSNNAKVSERVYESVADIEQSVRIAEILAKHEVDDFTIAEQKKVAPKELLAKYKASRAPAVAALKQEYLATSLQSIKEADTANADDDSLGDADMEKYFTLGRLLASTTYLSNSFTSQNLTVAKQVVLEPPTSPPHIPTGDSDDPVVLDEDPMSLYFYLGNAYAGVSMKYKTTHEDRQRAKINWRQRQKKLDCACDSTS